MAKIKLQGISQRFDGVAAKDLKIGDILVWNYGSKSEYLVRVYKMELLENEKQQQQENLPLNEKSQQIRLMKLLRRGKTLTAAYIAM